MFGARLRSGLPLMGDAWDLLRRLRELEKLRGTLKQKQRIARDASIVPMRSTRSWSGSVADIRQKCMWSVERVWPCLNREHARAPPRSQAPDVGRIFSRGQNETCARLQQITPAQCCKWRALPLLSVGARRTIMYLRETRRGLRLEAKPERLLLLAALEPSGAMAPRRSGRASKKP